MTLPAISVPQYPLTVPSTKQKIKFRPFLMKEEKLLLMANESNDEIEKIGAVKQVITDCIVSREAFDVEALAIFDLEYIFIQLRAKSVGEIAEPTVDCAKCEKSLTVEIDLTKIKVKFTKNHTNIVVIEPGLSITMKYPEPQQNTVAQGESIVDELDMRFNMIASCIDNIFTADTVYQVRDMAAGELTEWMEGLDKAAYEKIQVFFDTMPHLEHTVDYKCLHCDHEGAVVLRELTDFFV